MKRISFSHTPPRSKSQLRKTAFLAAAFLLLFANLFAFSLAEDFPGDPNGEAAQGEADGGENGVGGAPDDENETGEETGETDEASGAGDESGEPGDGSDGELRGGEDNPDADDAVKALLEEIMPLNAVSAGDEYALREAISNNSQGAGHDDIVLAGDVTLTDTPLTIPNGADVTLTAASGVTLHQDGYIISVESGGNLTLAGDLTIKCRENNTVTAGRNGGIHNKTGGTFTMAGGTITNGAGIVYNLDLGVYDGGGVYNAGEFTLTGGTISDNASDRGSGVYNTMSGEFCMNGGTISHNTASYEGGGIYSEASLTMGGGTVSYNVAVSGNSGGWGGGGGVRVTDAGEFTMSAGVITHNSAPRGGGVCASRSTMSGGTVSYNEAITGGGIQADIPYNDRYDQLTLTGGLIASNSAIDEGGGLYLCVNATGGTISGNTARNGGGVYGLVKRLEDGVRITGNTASENGGGMYICGLREDSAGEISGGEISYNAARNGGGVYRGRSLHGGYDRGSLTLTGGLIAGNSAIGDGGGLYFRQISATGGTISGNTARRGGGLYGIVSPARLAESVLGEDVIVANNTASEDGGGIYREGPFMWWTWTMAGTVEGNRAGRNGGGIWSGNAITLQRKGRVTDNEAGDDGGGVYLGTVFVPLAVGATLFTAEGGSGSNDALVGGNRAGRDGGGVYGTGVSLFSGGRVTDNEAGRDGGGIYIAPSRAAGGSSAKGAFLDNRALVADNRAGRNGGGICVAPGDTDGYDSWWDAPDTALFGGELEIRGGAIRGNTAALFGGGAYYAGYKDGLDFLRKGWYIYTYSAEENPSVENNTAAAGGGIYLATYENVTDEHRFGLPIDFSGNRALTGTITPSETDPVRSILWAKLNTPSDGTGAFGRLTHPDINSPFTNDDINYFGDVSVLYTDTGTKAADPLPGLETFTVRENFAALGTHTVADAQTATDGSPFLGWKLVGNILAFVGTEDAPRVVAAGTVFNPLTDFFRPLVNAVLNAWWDTTDDDDDDDPGDGGEGGDNPGDGGGGGGGGRPPGGGTTTPPGDDSGGGTGTGDGDEGGGTTEPGGDPSDVGTGGGATPPPASGTGNTAPRARSASPAVVANALPDLPAPQPEPEPMPEAEAVTPDTPAPAETQPPRGNALENFLATTGIAPLGIPLAAPDGSAWAILNLILALLSVVTAVFAGLRLRKARADAENGLESTARERRPALTYTALAAAFALVSVVVFVLTEYLSLAPVWLDRFSPLMLALFVLCAVFFALAERTRRASRADADLADAV